MPVLSLVPPVEVPHTPVATDTVEVSVVMPCLNEQESVGVCVEKALAGLAASGMVGEVIVCDNGSSDDSVAVARAAGASVVVKFYRPLRWSDAAIREAQKELWRNYCIIAEPGGAAAYGALTSGAYRPEPGERVGVLLCGANADLAGFAPEA